LATFGLGASVFGTIVQLTHWPLLRLLQVTRARPVGGHPVCGHVGVPSPEPLKGNGLISSLYKVPPELKFTPSLQFPLEVTMFAKGTTLLFWSKQSLRTVVPFQK
jgi:hypothetical protein